MVHLRIRKTIMSRNGNNGLPAYKKIQAAILKRVESGQLKPGWPRSMA